MKKINRTLLIGLGGAGIDILNSVKNQYEKSDSSPIEYLLIDIDKGHLQTAELLTKDEIYHIGIGGLGRGKKQRVQVDKWLSKAAMEQQFSGVHNSASVIRGLSRLGLLCHYDSIRKSLKFKIQKLKNHQHNQSGDLKDIQVVICFSICGATGSGIFLDVANFVKEYLNESDQITANILMPSIYDDKIIDPIGKRMIFGNAYASMRELDFFMSWKGWHKEPEYILEVASNINLRMHNHTSNGPFNNVNYYNNQDINNRYYHYGDIIDIVSKNIINNTENLFANSVTDARWYERCHHYYYNPRAKHGENGIDKRITQKMDDAKFELVSMTPNYNKSEK